MTDRDDPARVLYAALTSDNPTVQQALDHLLVVTRLAHGEEIAEEERRVQEMWNTSPVGGLFAPPKVRAKLHQWNTVKEEKPAPRVYGRGLGRAAIKAKQKP